MRQARARAMNFGRPATWLSVLLAGVVAAGGMMLPQSPADARDHTRVLGGGGQLENINVVQSKAMTLAANDDVGQVLIGNPEVADVVALTNRKIYVLGRKIGVTSVTLLDPEKNVIAVLNVNVTYDVELLRRRIKDSIRRQPDQGHVRQWRHLPVGHGLQCHLSAARDRHCRTGSHRKPFPTAISVRGTQQVLLEVRFIEANRNSSRELGVNLTGKGGGVSTTTGSALWVRWHTSGRAGVRQHTVRRCDCSNHRRRHTGSGYYPGAGETRIGTRTLAEPNLVAQSGQPAEFLAGGEFPFPVQADKDTVSVEFKKFGVGLAFTPTVLGEGLINLVIEPGSKPAGS